MDETFAVIVEHADRTNAKHVGNLNSRRVRLGIHFAIPAFPAFLVKSRTIFTVHARLAFGLLTVFSLLALGLAQTAKPPANQVQLKYANGSFSIVNGSETTRIPLQPSTDDADVRPPERILFRKDDAFVVWDARGLSIRKGEKVNTSLLDEIAVSPKLFSEAEIQESYALWFLGLRSFGAVRAVGAKRIGNSVFMIAEWQEVSGDAWLHVLLEADLSNEETEPTVVGRLPGLALNVTDDWDRLLLTQRGLVAFADGANGWGRVVVDAKAKALSFEPLGQGLVEVRKRSDKIAHYKYRTEYGSLVMGQVPLASGDAVPLIETKGNVRLLDSETPWLFVEADQKGRDLHNSETGAERMIPTDSGIRRTPKGILVWSPLSKPTFAELLDTSRLEVIARWTLNSSVEERTQSRVSKRGGG